MSVAEIVRKLKRHKDFFKIADALREAVAEEQRAREAFWQAADEDTRAEWIAGKVVLHSPVKGRHFIVSINLMGIVIPYVREHRLGQLAVESTLVACGRNDFMPDVAFWREERRGEIRLDASVFPAPDFVIEILSKSTEKEDRTIKMEAYAEAGVQELWLIDPRNLAIEVYYPGADGYFELDKTYQGGRVACRVLAGLEVEVRRVFEGVEES